MFIRDMQANDFLLGRKIMPKTLLEQCLAGELIFPEIAERIDLWRREHPTSGQRALQTFLGMTDAEFFAWTQSPTVIRQILFARRMGVLYRPNLLFEDFPVAARGNAINADIHAALTTLFKS